MSTVTGRAFIRINGVQQKSRPGATLNLGGINNETVVGDDGVHGPKQSITAPSINFSISHTKETKLAKLSESIDDSITFETDSGAIYIMNPSWLTTPPVLNSQEGTVELNYEGVRVEEA